MKLEQKWLKWSEKGSNYLKKIWIKTLRMWTYYAHVLLKKIVFFEFFTWELWKVLVSIFRGNGKLVRNPITKSTLELRDGLMSDHSRQLRITLLMYLNNIKKVSNRWSLEKVNFVVGSPFFAVVDTSCLLYMYLLYGGTLVRELPLCLGTDIFNFFHVKSILKEFIASLVIAKLINHFVAIKQYLIWTSSS